MPRLILILPLFWGCESEEQSVPHWETWTWSSLGEKNWHPLQECREQN